MGNYFRRATGRTKNGVTTYVHPSTMFQLPSSVPQGNSVPEKKPSKKYAYIPDNFSSLQQVILALKEAGLESSNLIVGIDFTKSNEWTGRCSFGNRSLHAIGDRPNPYEQAISIIGKTLAPFDEDNLIPCFGFGDATTHDQEVFSFHRDHSPCHGFEEVLACYKRIVPNLRLSGPTSFGPVVDAAVDIVEKHHGQYHVLLIIADGQVTKSVNTESADVSPQEQKTIQSIVTASAYPLSIVLVGVGDGPWDDMRKFDDKLPAREFDNFQFVNSTEIMSRNVNPPVKEAAFALAALMEIPIQYKACIELGLVGRVTGRSKKVVPRPPPVPYQYQPAQSNSLSDLAPVPNRYQPVRSNNLSNSPPVRSRYQPARQSSDLSDSDANDRSQACPICFSNPRDLAFGCGHTTCQECGQHLSNCPICRTTINNRLRLFTG